MSSLWGPTTCTSNTWPSPSCSMTNPKQSIAWLLASKMFPNWQSFENWPITLERDSGRRIVRILLASFHFLISFIFFPDPQKLTIWEYIYLTHDIKWQAMVSPWSWLPHGTKRSACCKKPAIRCPGQSRRAKGLGGPPDPQKNWWRNPAITSRGW